MVNSRPMRSSISACSASSAAVSCASAAACAFRARFTSRSAFSLVVWNAAVSSASADARARAAWVSRASAARWRSYRLSDMSDLWRRMVIVN